MTVPRRMLTSLLLVEERLLEADYFVRLMRRQGPGNQFGYCLNAFVSAARSVSFLMQKEMARVPGFDVWWSEQQQVLGSDPAARFFLKMRNFSQKEGRISLVGSGSGRSGGRWTYRFAGTSEKVPAQLLKRDVADCCVEHVGKLARVVLACAERFPYHSCPRRAMTPEGIRALGLQIEELDAELGFRPEWIQTGSDFLLADHLRLLSRSVDGLDFVILTRLSRPPVSSSVAGGSPHDPFGQEWTDLLVDQLEQHRKTDPWLAVCTILQRRRGTGGGHSGPSSDGSAQS